MATPYAQITDSSQSLQPALNNVDYSFLQQGLAKRSLDFEQGLSQIKNDYSSILNAPLTSTENVEQRKQYIGQIQEGLKKVATTDVSLPQNVTQAENLYAPFWKDSDILIDQAATKHLQNQFQNAETDRNSKDKDTRDSYNPNSIEQLQWVQQDLRNSKRGDGSIQSVYNNLPRYTPKTDPMEYMDAVDKAQGFKGVDFEYANGHGGIIKEHDGLKAVPQFSTRIDAALGEKFNPQFSVQGYNWYRQQKAQLLKQFPGIPEEQINQELAKQRYTDLKGMYENSVNGLQNSIKKSFDDPITIIQNTIQNEQGGKATPAQTKSIQDLQNQKTDYQNALNRAQGNLDEFKRKNYDKFVGDIAKNPIDYYTKQIRETTINNMAQGRAMGDYSITKDVDKAWQAASEDARWKSDISLRGKDLAYKYYNAGLEHQDRHEKNLVDTGSTFDANGNLIAPIAGGNPGQVQYLGENTTGGQHGHFADLLEQEKTTNLKTATNNTFSANGVTGVLSLPVESGGLGIAPGVLADFNTLYSRLYSPENIANKDFKGKPEENAAFKSVYNALSGYFGKDKPIPFSYDGLLGAIHNYVASENSKRVTTGTFTDTAQPFAKAFIASQVAKDALQNYSSMVRQEREWINHLAKNDKDKYAKLLNDERTGIASSIDIAKYAPTLQVQDEQGNQTVITPQQIGEAYNKSNFSIDGRELIIDGKQYEIQKVNNSPVGIGTNSSFILSKFDPIGGIVREINPLTEALNRLTNRFGTYEDRNQLNNQLAENAGKNLKFIKDKTGTIGGSFLYSFGNEKVPGSGEKLIVEALHPSNTISYYDENGKLLDPKDVRKIRAIGNSYKSIRDNFSQPTHNSVSEYGSPTTQFTVSSFVDGKGKIHTGETITAVQSPDARGEFISTIPQNNGVYIYQKLLQGQSISNEYSLSNSTGFRYSVDPDNRDHPTSVNITITAHKYNSGTGIIEDYVYPVQNVLLSVGPDKIMNSVNSMIANYNVELANAQKQINKRDAK